MAFGQVNNTAEVFNKEVTRYVGVLPVEVIAVNPNKKQLGEIYGREPEKEPSYIGEEEYEHPITKQKLIVKTARIDFIIRNEELNFLSKVTFFLRDTPWISNTGKCKVIDKFGRTAWVTNGQFSANEIPMYSNGPARIDSKYQTSYRNEEELVKFIKYYLGIPDVDKYIDGKWVERENPEDSIISLDKIKDYFNGDFRELEQVIELGKFNRIKVLAGVKIKDGNTYQDVYAGDFVRNSSNNYNQLFKNIQSTQANGGYSNSIFYVGTPAITNAKPWEGINPTNTAQDNYNPFASTPNSNSSSPSSAVSPSDLPF